MGGSYAIFEYIHVFFVDILLLPQPKYGEKGEGEEDEILVELEKKQAELSSIVSVLSIPVQQQQ